PRYRVQLLAQSMFALSRIMRTQADRFDPTTHTVTNAQMMREQAVLAEQLQAARDLLLESPRTPRRQQLAAMLINILEIRDHLLASELDLDLVKSSPEAAQVLIEMHKLMDLMADELDRHGDDLLFWRRSRP